MKKHIALCVVVGSVSCLSVPLFAAEGFHLGLQVGSAETLTEDQAIAYRANIPAPGEGTKLSAINLAYDRSIPFSLEVGYGMGDDDFSLTIFSVNQTSDQTLNEKANSDLLYADLDDVGGLKSETEIDVQLVDLNWRRDIAQLGDTRFFWNTGVRFGSLSQEVQATLFNNAATPTPDVKVTSKKEISAYGLTAGLDVLNQLSERFWFAGGFKLAYLVGDLDISAVFEDVAPPIGSSDELKERGQSVHILQTQVHARIGMDINNSCNLYLDYQVRNFGDLEGDSLNLISGGTVPRISGFGLAAFSLGMNYQF